MGLCPHPVGYVTKMKGDDIGVKVPVNCKRWSCSHCGKVNKKRVLDRVNYGFKGGVRVRGMTLTELKEPDNPEHEKISKHWARLRANLYKKGYKFRFFRVTEFRPRYCKTCRKDCVNKGKRQDCEFDNTQYRHYHILIDAYIPQEVVSNAWYEATNHTAYIVWMNKSEIKKAGGYFAKYITKTMNDEHFGRHERRFSFSQKCFPLVVMEELPDLDGISLGSIPTRVDGEKFRLPIPGEWEFTYDPAWWLRTADAIGRDEFCLLSLKALERMFGGQEGWRLLC